MKENTLKNLFDHPKNLNKKKRGTLFLWKGRVYPYLSVWKKGVWIYRRILSFKSFSKKRNCEKHTLKNLFLATLFNVNKKHLFLRDIVQEKEQVFSFFSVWIKKRFLFFLLRIKENDVFYIFFISNKKYILLIRRYIILPGLYFRRKNCNIMLVRLCLTNII